VTDQHAQRDRDDVPDEEGTVGHWEEMYGEVLLPAAAVPEVKKALREAHNRHADAVYDHAKAFWKRHATQSRTKYTAAVDAYVSALRPSSGRSGYYATEFSSADLLAGDLHHVLSLLDHTTQRASKPLRGATWADMGHAGLAKATNRDVSFGAGDGVVSFDGRTLRWHTDQNKRSIERFESSVVGAALYAALDRVTWSRGTGGAARGQDEYGVDAALHHGGNAVALCKVFGPIGAEAHRRQYGFYPQGSPEARAEQAKKQRRSDAAKRSAATRKAARQPVATGSFCGQLNAEATQLCGRLLTSAGCPTHGSGPPRASVSA
jgi:hypothetical protein